MTGVQTCALPIYTHTTYYHLICVLKYVHLDFFETPRLKRPAFGLEIDDEPESREFEGPFESV